MKTHWWRFALAAAGLVVGASFADAGLFLYVPVLLWCVLARTARTGLLAGVVLLALQVWFVVPRGLGWSGPWVPTAMEGFWLYPLLTAVVCVAGLLVDGRFVVGVVWLAAVVGVGLLGLAVAVLDEYEGAAPGDEDVLPVPAGLRLGKVDMMCGSGHGANCWRQFEATGERAHEVMRAHLESHDYTSANERFCRSTGLVSVREVCAELKDVSATAVKVTWYVNRG